MTADATPLVRLDRIQKRFGETVALRDVDFELLPGEIHALLGENGAGKSTLMHILSGLFDATSGRLEIEGRPTVFRSPRDAAARGIDMVHQHFMLVENLTVSENLALSLPEQTPFLLPKEPAEAALVLARQLGWELPADAYVWQLPVGMRQRLEIVKALTRRPRVLILDEPTAVLAPNEVDDLFVVLRRLRAEGTSIVFISHKLNEVLALCDRVTVLRHGEVAGVVDVAQTDARHLARMMMGTAPPAASEGDHEPPADEAAAVLEVTELVVRDERGALAVDGLSLQVRAGEILGVAGVDGNGQTELAEAILGLRPLVSGTVSHSGEEGPGLHGAGYIPQDRRRSGLALGGSVRDNLILELHQCPEYRRGPFLRWRALNAVAEEMMERFDIRATGPMQTTAALSGGNQQKIVVARALQRQPAFIVAVNPTRGLDIGATDYVRRGLREQCDRGAGILLISTELDEVTALADRVTVIYEGRLVGEVPPTASRETLGLMMGGKSLDALAH